MPDSKLKIELMKGIDEKKDLNQIASKNEGNEEIQGNFIQNVENILRANQILSYSPGSESIIKDKNRVDLTRIN